jgi:hypothetical protein
MKEDKPKKQTKGNRKGFYTDNNTQDMSKGHPKQRALATTQIEIPAGESGLPELH